MNSVKEVDDVMRSLVGEIRSQFIDTFMIFVPDAVSVDSLVKVLSAKFTNPLCSVNFDKEVLFDENCNAKFIVNIVDCTKIQGSYFNYSPISLFNEKVTQKDNNIEVFINLEYASNDVQRAAENINTHSILKIFVLDNKAFTNDVNIYRSLQYMVRKDKIGKIEVKSVLGNSDDIIQEIIAKNEVDEQS